MLPHRNNPYLNSLLTPQGIELVSSRRYVHSPDKRPQNRVLWDPTLGNYEAFTWKNGFDPTKEIVVVMDGHSPSKHPVFHSHDFFELVYVYTGRCHTQLSGNSATLIAGDMCLYNLQAVHKADFFQSGDVIFNIIVRQELFRHLVLELLSESDAVSSFFINSLYNRKSADTCILLHPSEEHLCESLAQQIVETYFRDRPMCQNALKSQLMSLLLEIVRQHQEQQICRTDSRSLSVKEVLSYINQNYQTTSLEDTASHFGYSTRSMTRFLQKYVGQSFRDVLRDIRFSHARSMLQETSMSIDDIAGTLGYYDRSNFENAFKKSCFITPAAYRRQFFSK